MDQPCIHSTVKKKRTLKSTAAFSPSRPLSQIMSLSRLALVRDQIISVRNMDREVLAKSRYRMIDLSLQLDTSEAVLSTARRHSSSERGPVKEHLDPHTPPIDSRLRMRQDAPTHARLVHHVLTDIGSPANFSYCSVSARKPQCLLPIWTAARTEKDGI